MKNSIILRAVHFLQRRFPISPPPLQPRILVVASTALGDTLWSTPALESLRKSFAQAYIAVLTSPIGEQVLRHSPWVDHIFVLDKPLIPTCFKLWKQLRQETFQDIVIFHASQRAIFPLCALLGAKRIVGTYGLSKGLDSLLTDAVPPCAQHEIKRRLGLIERIGAFAHSNTLSFFLQPEERAAGCFAKIIHVPLIVLHPGSKDGFKRWPLEHFSSVGRALQELGAQILITGTKEELTLMKKIAEQIPGAQIADPSLSLRHFGALLEQVDLLISNDTGPVHLACALRTPVIALYSPTDPLLCGPYKAHNAVAITRPPTCESCLKRRCRRPFCMLQIGPEEVIRAAKNMLIPNVN